MLVAPLAFFYFYFFAWTIKDGSVPPSNPVEAIILATMTVRLVAMLSVRRLRQAKASLIVDVFAADVLVIAALLAFFAVTRATVYMSVLTTYATAWPTALLLVFPPFAMYRFASRMLAGAGLSNVVPSAIGLFALLVIPAEVATLQTRVQSLGATSHLLLSVLLGQAESTVLLPEITFTGFLFFFALTLYAVTRDEASAGRSGPLTVAIAGSLVALGWSEAGAYLTDDLFLLFAVPGLTIIGIIWWTTRGHQ
jgi:hypothetical protein